MAMKSKSTTTKKKPLPPSLPRSVVAAEGNPAPEAWKPHAYQKRAMRWLLEKAQAALFLDPGLGKTAISLGVVSILKKQGLTKGALVVAPKRVALSVWPGERERWIDFHDLSMAVLHGKGKELAATKHDLYVINFEGLPWLIESGTLDALLRKGWVDTLIVDELSRFKAPRTQRFKLVKPWLHKFRRRIGLTGTPAPNGLMDLFGQIYVLDRGARLGQYITHYRQNYFLPDGLYDWKIKPGAERLIYDRISDLALRMDAKDYLDLPPKVDNIIRVDLPPKAASVYRDMEEEMIALLDGGARVTAANAASVSGKCRQIANGALYEDPIDPITGEPKAGKREWLPIHDAKIEALRDLVDELQGAPMLVAYEFQHDLARLRAAFPGTPFIGGGTNDKDAAQLEKEWNANRLPLLFAHPASVGHGLNLQRGGASHICWFGLTWDFELYDQMNRRLLRQGTTAQRIMVHHIVARGTVDEVVMATLRLKRRTQDDLLAALRRRR